MPNLFRRTQAITCYYCQSAVLPSSPVFPSFGTNARRGGLTFSGQPFDPNFFRCPHCGCWNRYNSRGEILSDEPAMHDEKMNTESFSKRGSPDRNHLPSVYSSNNARGEGFFCHTCQTNQTLLVNLLSNYLPAPDDPSYKSRVAALSTYTASLQLRYPPVCAECRPAVEEEIARKDEMARTRALGGALKVSNRYSPTSARFSSTHSKATKNLISWKTRGFLWVMNLAVVIGVDLAGIFNLQSLLTSLIPVLPLFSVVSLAWAFWDPTFSLRNRTDIQGRTVRVEGRRKYIFLQSILWLSRLSASLILLGHISPKWNYLNTIGSRSMELNRPEKMRLFFGSSLIIEIMILLFSYFSISIHRPAPIRLIDTSAHRALTPSLETSSSTSIQTYVPSTVKPISTPSLDEPDLFATLSLSSNPIITNYAATAAANPIFGKPAFAPLDLSLQQQNQLFTPSPRKNAALYDDDDDGEGKKYNDPDAMDWEPATPAKKQVHKYVGTSLDDGSWLRRQRFFPPEEPTGLEGLLMRTRLIDEDDSNGVSPSNNTTVGTANIANWSWTWVYSLSVLPVLVLLISLWMSGIRS